MHARIGLLRALNRHVERVFHPAGKTRIGTAEAQARNVMDVWADPAEAARALTLDSIYCWPESYLSLAFSVPFQFLIGCDAWP
jgi:hypothetical protein